jgi:hypothetical protein
MTVQTPAPPRQPEHDREPSTGYRVAAILFWIATVVVGLYGAMGSFGLAADAGAAFVVWSAFSVVFAVLFGALLGGAVVTTRKVWNRHRGGSGKAFLWSLLAAFAVYGALGLLGLLARPGTEQAESQACSADEVAMLEEQTYYGDLDEPPAGTQVASCYVLLTIEGTGQQAWIDLEQLLLDNGWQHHDPDRVAYEAGMWLEHDGFVLIVFPEGSPDLPIDDFTPTDDGATTFALQIGTY